MRTRRETVFAEFMMEMSGMCSYCMSSCCTHMLRSEE